MLKFDENGLPKVGKWRMARLIKQGKIDQPKLKKVKKTGSGWRSIKRATERNRAIGVA